MDIKNAPVVQDLRIYAVRNVSKEHGRRRLAELQARGQIRPLRTPTGRKYLNFEDAERLAAAL